MELATHRYGPISRDVVASLAITNKWDDPMRWRVNAAKRCAARSAEFDYSTPEAQQAMAGVTDLVLELQQKIERKTVLYERTLGLAVAPVLARRAALVLCRRARAWRQGIR